MAGENLNILLQAILNKPASLTELNKAIKELENDPRLQKIKIKMDMNTKILDMLTTYNRTINQITQSIQAQNYVVNNHTNTLSRQTQALKDATEAQKQFVAEKQKKVGVSDAAKTVGAVTPDKSNFIESSKSVKEIVDYVVAISSVGDAFKKLKVAGDWFLNFVGVSATRISQLSAKIVSFMTSLGYSAAAANVFAASLITLATTLLPLAIITGVTFAISKFVEVIQKKKAEEKALADQQSVIANSWYTQQDNIKLLVAEYNNLNSIKNRTQTQDERYLEISNQLASLLPNLAASVDQKGQAHLKNAKAIEQELAYAGKLSALESGKKIANSENNVKEIIDSRKKVQNEIDGIDSKLTLGFTIVGTTAIKIPESELITLQMRKLGLEQQLTGMTGKLKDEITSTTALMSGMKPNTAGIESYKNIIDNLDLDKIEPKDASKKIFDIGNALKNLQTIQSVKKTPESEKAYSIALGVLRSNLKLTDQELQDFIKTMNSSSPSSDKASNDTVKFADRLSKLKSYAEDSNGSFSSLASAYQKLQQGEQLSTQETLKLSNEHPLLLDYLAKHNGLIEDKGEILQWVAGEERKTALAEAISLNTSATNTYNALETKRKLYKNFYEGINPVNPLIQDANFIKKYGKKEIPEENNPAKFSPITSAELKEQAEAKEKMQQTKILMDFLSKPIEFPASAPKSEVSSGSSSFEEYKIDAYKNSLQELDLQLKESESIMSRYTETSEKYRDELSKQVEIAKEKLKLTSEEGLTVRAKITELESQLSKTSDKEKKNQITQQLDETKSKLAELSNSWWDYEVNIEQSEKKLKESLFNFSKDWINNEKSSMELLGQSEVEVAQMVFDAWKRMSDKRDQYTIEEQDEINNNLAQAKDALKKSHLGNSENWMSEESERMRLTGHTEIEVAQMVLDARKRMLDENWTKERGITELSKAERLKAEKDVASASWDLISVKINKATHEVSNYDDALSASKSKMSMLTVGSADYTMELSKQVSLMSDKLKAEENLEKVIRSSMSAVNLSNENWQNLNDQLRKSILNQINIAQQLSDQMKTVADDVVSIYKDMYEKQKEAAAKATEKELEALETTHKAKIKMLDDEMNKYDELINAKIKALDDQASKDDYNKQLAKLQKERDEITNKISISSLNDSPEAKAKRADLQNQLNAKNEEIDKFTTDRSITLQKDNLQQQLDEKKKQSDAQKTIEDDAYEKTKIGIENQKTLMDQYYDDLINNEREFAKIREEIAKGNFDRVKKDFASFQTFLTSNSGIIGTSISENISDKISQASGTIEQLSVTMREKFSDIANSMQTGIIKTIDDLIEKLTKASSMQYSSSTGSTSPTNGNSNSGSNGNGFYFPTDDREKHIKEMMKQNSGAWSDADTDKRKELEQSNRNWAAELGDNVKYDNGTWFKNGLPLYHEGGEVGVEGTTQKSWVEKVLKLNPNELLSILKKGEVVLNDPMQFIGDIASRVMGTLKPTIPTFQMSSSNRESGDSTYHFDFHIDKLVGDEKGGQDFAKGFMKSLNLRGVNT
ncbi:hypothetical protein BC351_10270 [Paenibacillus ferrarius]|uniref:Phage tail tape measure protein n=2 Tax=Paenibacillus ferrarius TaxID=1469647 RepID=A0A1V4H988_9BACL|nr:hypothetical protein BC351_10270 [Paenibacillus ferrarius]